MHTFSGGFLEHIPSTFVSLVGTQVMAVLNPILALDAHSTSKIKEIMLFHTSAKGSVAAANSLHKAINAKYGAKVAVTLQNNESGKSPQDAVKEILSSRPAVFNLAGGMAFQIAQCLWKLGSDEWNKAVFVYPEAEGVHAIHVLPSGIKKLLLPLPQPVDVLSLQQVPFESISRRRNPLDRFLCTRQLKPFRRNLAQVSIDGVAFDHHRNVGNQLTFIKVIPDPEQKSVDAHVQVRRLIDLATDRQKWGELYNRTIMIVTADPEVHERLEEGDEIEKLDHTFVSRETDLDLLFTDLLTPGKQSRFRLTAHPETITTGNIVEGGTLITVLGENLGPSFSAIWTHRPAKLILAYTPDSKRIRRYVEAIRAHSHLLPVSEITFYPTDVSGANLLKIKAPQGSVLNVTPGTKGQTFFLSRWAVLHDGDIYTIETNRQVAISISSGQSIPLDSPLPSTYATLTGERDVQVECSVEQLRQSGEVYEALLSLFAAISNDRDQVSGLSKFLNAIGSGSGLREGESNEYVVQGVRFLPHTIAPRLITMEEDNVRHELNVFNGQWFETLVGFAVLKAGADDVEVRVHTLWSEKTAERLLERHGSDSHRNDFDVVARFKSQYFVFEAKSGNIAKHKQETIMAKARAKLFGRFALPVFARMNYWGNPAMENGLLTIGIKTLVDPEQLKSELFNALQTRRTTQNP